MGDSAGPPRVAEWLLRRLLPRDRASVVCDDVAERYRRSIVPTRGRWSAWLWYWGEVLRSVGPARELRRLRRGGRDRRYGGGMAGVRSAVDGWLVDVRFAWRTLFRHPGWSLAAMGLLALGIGGTTAMYGAVRALVLSPLPYGDESRIVAFTNAGDWSGPEFETVRDWAGPFSALAAGTTVDWTFRGDALEPGLVAGMQATAGLFEVLGVSAARGRSFGAGDDVPGAEPVVVLSHALWAGRLGGDPGIVGRTIVLDGVARTVIGVMPERFYFPTPETRFWASMPMSVDLWDYGLLTIVGRVAPGSSLESASGSVAALGAILRERFTYTDGWDKTRDLGLLPVRDFLVGDAGRPLALLLGAVALLLLVACANVSALVLGRGLDRRGEVAVRAALGAGRRRLVLQAFTESIVLALPGGVAGAVAALLGFAALRQWLPVDDAWREALVPDWTLPLAALAVTLAAGCVLGVVAVQAVRRAGLEATLRSAGRAGRSSGGGRALPALVIGEIALTIVLVASAAALLRSVSNLQRRDPGMDPAGVLVVDVAVGSGDFDEAGRHEAFAHVLERVRSIPGVTSAALTQRLPMRDGGWQGPVRAEGSGDDGPSSVLWRHVTPGYFRTLGVPVVRGRVILESDDARSPGAVVVSRSLAEALWPGADPIGRRMRTGMTPAGEWLTVAGIVEDAPMLGLRDAVRPVVYIPWDQAGVTMEGNTILARTSLPLAGLAATVRTAIGEAESRVAVARTQSMASVVRQSIAEPRRITLFINLFGGLALVLGAIGVHGVLAGFVRGRLFEFGVRMALGATPGSLARFVLSRAGLLIAAGVAMGIPLSLAASRVYSTFLYGVAPGDALSIGLATLVLSAAGVLAAWVPSRRAAAASPAAVLRAD